MLVQYDVASSVDARVHYIIELDGETYTCKTLEHAVDILHDYADAAQLCAEDLTAEANKQFRLESYARELARWLLAGTSGPRPQYFKL